MNQKKGSKASLRGKKSRQLNDPNYNQIIMDASSQKHASFIDLLASTKFVSEKSFREHQTICG